MTKYSKKRAYSSLLLHSLTYPRKKSPNPSSPPKNLTSISPNCSKFSFKCSREWSSPGILREQPEKHLDTVERGNYVGRCNPTSLVDMHLPLLKLAPASFSTFFMACIFFRLCPPHLVPSMALSRQHAHKLRLHLALSSRYSPINPLSRTVYPRRPALHWLMHFMVSLLPSLSPPNARFSFYAASESPREAMHRPQNIDPLHHAFARLRLALTALLPQPVLLVPLLLITQTRQL